MEERLKASTLLAIYAVLQTRNVPILAKAVFEELERARAREDDQACSSD